MSATSTNTKTAAQPAGTRPAEAPPFWELEDLIAQGHTREQALAIMISRRDGTLEAFSERPRETTRRHSDQAVLLETALSA